MFFKGKHEAARMELRFINKTGNKHFDKQSYIYICVCMYVCGYMMIYDDIICIDGGLSLK